MSWFTNLFKKRERKPWEVDARKARIDVVLKDEREFSLSFHGWATSWGSEAVITDASDVVQNWFDRNSTTRFVNLGGGMFVPIDDVKSLQVTYMKHMVEVDE